MTTKLKWFLAFLLVSLPLDQISKTMIVHRFHYGERLTVIDDFFTITHVRNPGGAFSFFADGPVEYRMLFFIGAALVALVLLVVFLRQLEPDSRLAASALGMIMGGAVGNLTDRLVYGEVIDWLEFQLTATYTWPTFNIADSTIVVGVAILMVEVFYAEEPAESEEPVSGDVPPASPKSAG